MLGLQFISHKGRNWTILQSIILGFCSIADGLVVVLSLGYCWPTWEISLMEYFLRKNLSRLIKRAKQQKINQ